MEDIKIKKAQSLAADRDFCFRMAVDEDAETVNTLMQEIYGRMPLPEYFVCEDLTYVKSHIREKGFTILACSPDGEIAGFLIIHFPGRGEDNLGVDTGVREDELDKVAVMDICMVVEKARGHHLERRLLLHAEQFLPAEKYRYLTATAHPENAPSVRSLKGAGYEIKTVKEKYGGKLRAVMQKDRA